MQLTVCRAKQVVFSTILKTKRPRNQIYTRTIHEARSSGRFLQSQFQMNFFQNFDTNLKKVAFPWYNK